MEPSIRDLYDKIIEFEGEKLFESVLKKWVIDTDYKRYISTISSSVQIEKANLTQEENWELYALSRVLDILTLQFQPDNQADGSEWLGPKISIPEFEEFISLIGLDVITPNTFNPFNCEIIHAQEGENNFEIIESYFPAVKLKNMIIKRAGMKISLKAIDYNLTLINNASIYWTFRRKNRIYFDLSQGWGSNSQWSTDLRLDLETNNHFVYNQNGRFDLNHVTPELLDELNQQNLEIQEAIDLTRFRHFVTSTKDDSDLFPYDFKYEEEKNQLQHLQKLVVH